MYILEIFPNVKSICKVPITEHFACFSLFMIYAMIILSVLKHTSSNIFIKRSSLILFGFLAHSNCNLMYQDILFGSLTILLCKIVKDLWILFPVFLL